MCCIIADPSAQRKQGADQNSEQSRPKVRLCPLETNPHLQYTETATDNSSNIAGVVNIGANNAMPVPASWQSWNSVVAQIKV
jgi:hypothetical protein